MESNIKNIDIAKEEAIAQKRYGGTGGTPHKYDLSPEKKNRIHDDRMYVLAMLAWHLKNLRRDSITNKKVEPNKLDLSRLGAMARKANIYRK